MDISDFFNITPISFWEYYNGDEIHSKTHYDETIPAYDIFHYFNEIRLSIFGIVAVCVGLPCLIWAFYSVHHQKKASGRVSAFIILLLLNDLLQLLLYPYIVSCLLSFVYSFHHHLILIVSVCLKIAGLHLQALVALEAALTLKYPMISAHIFSCPCYIIITIIILLIPVMCVLLLVFVGPFAGHMCLYLIFGSFLLPACLLVATGIIIYKTPPAAASTPVTDSRPGAMVFTVSLVTLLVLYLPSAVAIFQQIHFFDNRAEILTMTICLVSFTVISEPLLCVLVCRQNLSAQTKHTAIECNSEQTSV